MLIEFTAYTTTEVITEMVITSTPITLTTLTKPEVTTESITPVIEIPLITETTLKFLAAPFTTTEIYLSPTTTVSTYPSLPTIFEIATLLTTTETVSKIFILLLIYVMYKKNVSKEEIRSDVR